MLDEIFWGVICKWYYQHKKAKPELILHFLGVRIQLSTPVQKDESAFLVVAFQLDIETLFDHALDPFLFQPIKLKLGFAWQHSVALQKKYAVDRRRHGYSPPT